MDFPPTLDMCAWLQDSSVTRGAAWWRERPFLLPLSQGQSAVALICSVIQVVGSTGNLLQRRPARRRLRRLRWRSQQGNGGSALRAEGPARPCLPPLCCLPAGWMMIEQKYTVCWLIYVTLSDSIVQQPHDVWSLPQLSTEGKAERRRRKLHSWSECEMYEDGGAEDSHTCKYE